MSVVSALAGSLSKAVYLPIIKIEFFLIREHKLRQLAEIFVTCNTDIVCLIVDIAVTCTLNMLGKFNCIVCVSASGAHPQAEF